MGTPNVTTTYFFFTDTDATDRTHAPRWSPPEDSPSQPARIRWASPPARQ